MSFKYELPPGYELTPIPTDAERKKECRRLVGLLDEYKETVERIDGLVGYGIGISKVCLMLPLCLSTFLACILKLSEKEGQVANLFLGSASGLISLGKLYGYR